MSLPEDATHFGMGSGQFPIAEPVLQQRLQKLGKEHKCYKRNGLRFLQKHCFQETTLVAPKLNQRLPAQRDKPCGEKHRGFCKQEVVDDDDEKVIFESMVAHLKKNEHMDRSGDVIYSFLIWRQQEEEITLADRQYYQFMFFRGAPKYATTYARMDRIGTNEMFLRLALEKRVGTSLPCCRADKAHLGECDECGEGGQAITNANKQTQHQSYINEATEKRCDTDSKSDKHSRVVIV